MKPENVTSPSLLDWCRLGGAGEEDAHDVVQEVFRAVAGSLKPGNGRCHLGMYPVAVRIAKSRVLARLREEAGDLVT